MIDGVNDEVTDWLDAAEGVLMMEGARVVEALARRRAERREMAANADRDAGNEARARLRVDAAQSRMRLQPVLSEKWWTSASQERIAEHYKEAKAWEGIDPSFAPYVERIEAEAKAWHDLEPHQLMDRVVPRTESQLAREQKGPMTVDEARAAALTTPAWYNVHERLATDLPPFIRSKEEKRLVADMMHVRDTGKLDTESARMEWARFTDHPSASMVQDENESLSQFEERRGKMAQEHWDHTVEDRAGIGMHHENMAGVARPMSVSEAREFMEEFAPDWFKFGHAQIENAEVSWEPGEMVAHTREMNDQMRYAMEHLRDTGTLEHSYARSMRDTLALNPDIDLSVGAKPVSTQDRVRFGGSELARPMTLDEAKRLVEFTPDWYSKPVLGALDESTMLSPAQRAGQADALVSDMTRLRDHGVLDTDHAMRVWAAQQPSAVDPKWGESLPVKSIWADTVESRDRPRDVPQEVREAVGAGVPREKGQALRGGVIGGQEGQEPTQGAERPREAQERSRERDVADRVQVEMDRAREKESKERAKVEEVRRNAGWDTSEARVARARSLREAGFDPEEVRAQMLSDWNCATPPSGVRTTQGKAPEQPHRHHVRGQEQVKGKTLRR